VVDNMVGPTVRGKEDSLATEAFELECQIKQVQDGIDSLVRMQQRYKPTLLTIYKNLLV
jgi:hypothetical protein